MESRVDRRTALATLTKVVGGVAYLGASADVASAADLRDWPSVWRQFQLDRRHANFATFLLAAHPASVRAAIDRHRRALDRDAAGYLREREDELEARVLSAASSFLRAPADEIALTDSTTMGLGLLYGGLRLKRGDEIVTSAHDFYSTHESLRLAAARNGARVRKIQLYGDRGISTEQIVDAVSRTLTPRTRVVALTWVHSSTGVKLPIRAIARIVAKVNAQRDERTRILLCVDAVHGFGVEASMPSALGCDFFVSGCHKWLFGPRGTGFVWGRAGAWKAVAPTIPSFDRRQFEAWFRDAVPTTPHAAAVTPGGFHSFEHRWALADAFAFTDAVGRERIAARTHALAARLKAGLADMRHVALVTPRSSALSAGLVCFDVPGQDPADVVARLAKRGVVATVTPYARRLVRFGPSYLNSPAEVDAALAAVRALR